MSINYKCGNDKMKDFPDTSKIIWKDRNYLRQNVGDTTRKRKAAQMQHRLSVAVLSCAVCPKGLPVIPYTARKKYTGWSGAALCQLRGHKCPHSRVAAFVGWLVGVFCDCHESWRAIVGIIFRHQTYLSNQKSKKNTQWQWKICKTKAHYLQAFDQHFLCVSQLKMKKQKSRRDPTHPNKQSAFLKLNIIFWIFNSDRFSV